MLTGFAARIILRVETMEKIKIVVSPVIKQDGRQKIFISFIDDSDKREAEAIIPVCGVLWLRASIGPRDGIVLFSSLKTISPAIGTKGGAAISISIAVNSSNSTTRRKNSLLMILHFSFGKKVKQ